MVGEEQESEARALSLKNNPLKGPVESRDQHQSSLAFASQVLYHGAAPSNIKNSCFSSKHYHFIPSPTVFHGWTTRFASNNDGVLQRFTRDNRNRSSERGGKGWLSGAGFPSRHCTTRESPVLATRGPRSRKGGAWRLWDEVCS